MTKDKEPRPVIPPSTPLLDPPDDADEVPAIYPATYVAEFQGPGIWPFPLTKASVVIGNGPRSDEQPTKAAANMIVIPGRDLSAEHCTLQRRSTSIRAIDQQSTNGTYVKGSRIGSWDIRIGDKFSPWPMTLFLMDDAMAKNRDPVARLLGEGHAPSADTLLTDVVRQSGHIIIAGPPGAGHVQLALAIHEMSLRSTAKPVALIAGPSGRSQLALAIQEMSSRSKGPPAEIKSIPEDRAGQADLLRSAAKPKNTIILELPKRYKEESVDATFLSNLYSPSYGIRVIASVFTEDIAERVLPRQAFLMSYRINLRPLAMRAAEIDSLLDYFFVQHDAPHLKSERLTTANLDALHDYAWPRNFDELSEVAEAIASLDRHRSLRGASRVTGEKYHQIRDTLRRPGITMHRIGDKSDDDWTVFAR